MIRSFRDKRTATVFAGKRTKDIPVDLFLRTRNKLLMVNAAVSLDDLRVPSGNRLHALERDRSGQHAIRINDQYRICFRWTDAGPEDVEIVDYH